MENNKWTSVGSENGSIHAQQVLGAWVCFSSTDRTLLYDGVTCEQSSGDGYQSCEMLSSRFLGVGKSAKAVQGEETAEAREAIGHTAHVSIES